MSNAIGGRLLNSRGQLQTACAAAPARRVRADAALALPGAFVILMACAFSSPVFCMGRGCALFSTETRSIGREGTKDSLRP